MAPKPAGKDLEFFTALTSTFSLRKFSAVKWTIVRTIASVDKLETAKEVIEEHGTGADLEWIRDPVMSRELEDIARYFESRKRDLTTIMDNATSELKDFLKGGPPSRFTAFSKFQEIMQNANRSSRMKNAAKKLDMRREFDAELERLILGDDDNDVKLKEVQGLVAGYLAIATAASGYEPNDD